MPNEADTCRKFVVPGLQAAGWDTDPHRLSDLQVKTAAEIDALLPAVLDSAFRGEL